MSASGCVFYAQGVVKGGWICSNYDKYDGFGSISCFEVFCVFFCLSDRFGWHFFDFWGSLDEISVVRKLMQILIEKPGRE